MLRNLFPSSSKGAEMYGGFLQDKNCFCRTFPLKENITDSLETINKFLNDNGYDVIDIDDLEEGYSIEKYPITLASHGYKEELVLFIERDRFSLPQEEFIKEILRRFRDDRNWKQFHNAKDLSIALNIESSELLELFLWKDSNEANIQKVKEELADIFSYAYLIAENYDFNIEDIILDKIELNSNKYPISKSKGISDKYTDL